LYVFIHSGEKLGVWLALFPTIYLSAGTATALILVGGETMKLFYQIVCGPLCLPSPISTVEWYLVFTSLSVVLSQLPNLNSIAGVSLIGGATAIMYCTMSWVLSVSQQRPSTVSYEPAKYTSFGSSLFSTMNALGIIAFAFRGHNLALEIQVCTQQPVLSDLQYFVLCWIIWWLNLVGINLAFITSRRQCRRLSNTLHMCPCGAGPKLHIF
jgi:hypothetical protein